MARSVVLMSGGYASAVMAALAADEGEAVWLHVDYGQRNAEREAAAVQALAAHYRPAALVTIAMGFWPQLGDFAVLTQRDRLPDAMAIRGGPDVAWVPGLMPAMIAAGYSLACTHHAECIFVGLIEDRGISDIPARMLYPDRSRECVAAWNWQLQVAGEATGKPVRVEAPLISSRQGDIALLAQRLGVPAEHTWSCYREGPAPCRRCLGCAARAHGFLQIAAADPLLAPTK